MKLLKNQNGYALILVLLVVVLFLGISATFIAGSLNHAKQELTIDTRNQSIAAAEMGVLYYTEDFETTLKVLRDNLLVVIQNELDDMADCDTDCDNTLAKKQLDDRMKAEYIARVTEKVNHMDINDNLYLKTSSSDGRMNYTVDSASAVQTADKIEISFDLKGKAKQGDAESESILTVLFDVEVPDSFLVTSNNITYDDVYKETPTESCEDIINSANSNTISDPPYECKLGDNQKLSDLIIKITNAGLNPENFRVYTDNYLENVCEPTGNSSNCNENDFKGISVVINSDTDTNTGNMIKLTNFKLYVSGKLIVDGNLNNSGQNALVLKEIVIRNNIKNMDRSTLTVLGYEGLLNTASFELKNNINITNSSRICIDIDLIKKTDLDLLGTKLSIDNTSSLIYYTVTQDPSHEDYKTEAEEQRHFSLSNVASNERVKVETNYSNFLKMCGVSVSSSHTVPNVIDTGFDFEVDYTPEP